MDGGGGQHARVQVGSGVQSLLSLNPAGGRMRRGRRVKLYPEKELGPGGKILPEMGGG